MRFRKSISLGGGSKINFSKSGMSMTVGGKGGSFNFGKKGVYANYGIPGTGIYDRKKIFGKSASSNHSNSYGGGNAHQQPGFVGKELEIVLQEDGTVVFKDDNGNVITDASVVSALKRNEAVKHQIAELSKQRMEMYSNDLNQIINIQKLSEHVLTENKYIERIAELKKQGYSGQYFGKAKPNIESIVAELQSEAENTISARFGKKKLVQRYVDETKDIEYEKQIKQWIEEKKAFEKEQESLKNDYYNHIDELEKVANGDMQLAEKSINEWLSGIQFPFEFNLSYQLVEEKKTIFVDLDLPEIEDMMTKKAQQMANGIVKMKEKSQKEIKADYSTCAFGLAIFFASNFFNMVPTVNVVVISGFTQRRNKKGDIQDDYIYSIAFEREKFINLDYENTDPRENCMKFTNRCNQNADMAFKAIEPYGN